MKSPAELFVESITEWPETMASDNLSSDDWYEVASIYSNTRIEQADANVGLSLVAAIEAQGLTIDNFKGTEGLFVFAYDACMHTNDIERIKKWHKIHGQSIVHWANTDRNRYFNKCEFFKNIFTPKEDV